MYATGYGQADRTDWILAAVADGHMTEAEADRLLEYDREELDSPYLGEHASFEPCEVEVESVDDKVGDAEAAGRITKL